MAFQLLLLRNIGVLGAKLWLVWRECDKWGETAWMVRATGCATGYWPSGSGAASEFGFGSPFAQRTCAL